MVCINFLKVMESGILEFYAKIAHFFNPFFNPGKRDRRFIFSFSDYRQVMKVLNKLFVNFNWQHNRNFFPFLSVIYSSFILCIFSPLKNNYNPFICKFPAISTDIFDFSPDFSASAWLKNLAGVTRLELAAFCVTGRRSNQTELHPRANMGRN